MIPSTNSRDIYVGNGSASSYDYTFRILDEDDLLIVVTDSDGIETTLVINTDYTVTGVGNEAGGSISLVDADQDWLDASGDLDTGWEISIRRVRPLTQETDIRNQGAYFASLHEDAFDHLVMIDQQQQDELNRSIRFPEGEEGGTPNVELPTAANRANKFLAFDADGEPMVTEGTIDGIPVSSFAETILNDNSAAEVRATIGAATQADVDAVEADVVALEALGRWETGDIKWSAITAASTGWLSCNGDAVSRTTYANLFSAIGTTFGAGDGSTTFNVPNLSRRVPVGKGGSSTSTLASTMGSTGGEETHTLTTAEIPSHTHSERGNVSSTFNTPGTGSFSVLASAGTGTTGSAGSGSAHNNMQPSLVLSAFIKT